MIRQEKKAGGGNRTASQNTHIYNSTIFEKFNKYLLDVEAPCRWFPQARRYGQSLRVGSLAGEKGESLWISLESGGWYDHATDEGGGDLISLYAAMKAISQGRALREIRGDLPATVNEVPPPKASHVRNTDAYENEKKRISCALNIWDKSEPLTGTPAEKYLHNRGLSHTADMPLKYHPACPCEKSKHPAMIALMTDIETNESVGIHRTFITQDSEKAHIKNPKMMMGGATNAVIRLTPDEDVTMGLGIVEGIEDGLAILGLGWGPIWVALSANGVAKFPVLPGIEALTIFAGIRKTACGTG